MRDSFKWGFLAWLALRILTMLGAAWSGATWTQGETVLPPSYAPAPLPSIGDSVVGPWLRADAHWYLKIAEQGYEDPGAFAFMPAFPLAIRALSWTGISSPLAAFLIANIATLFGLVFLHALFSSWTDRRSARVSVMAVALFPTAFFLVAPYAESVFLLSGSAALLLADRRRWAASGIAAFVVSLTRPFGVLLILPLIGIALKKSSRDETRFLPAAGSLGGWITWMVFVWRVQGDFLGSLRIQQVWQRSPKFFPWTVRAGFEEAARWWGTDLGPYFLTDLAVTLLLVALVPITFMVLRKKPAGRLAGAGAAAYTAAVLIAALSYPFSPRPLLSIPRFGLAAFPSASVAGSLPRAIAIVLGAASAAALVVLSAAFVAARPIF